MICALSMLHFAFPAAGEWKMLEDGLALGVFDAPLKSSQGDSKITVLRVDTTRFDLKLFCAAQFDSVNLTTRQWCRRHKLVAAINAGMYAKDYSTHIGYMKNYTYVNNPRLRGDYKAVLAFNPVKGAAVPPVQIIDLECQKFDAYKNKYNSFVQNIRMIDCRRKNVWSRQPQQWSCAALAMDSSGHVLLLFSRSPYTVHDFINILLRLPLSIYNAMYLEGGGPASMYVHSGTTTIECYGMAEGGTHNDGELQFTHPLPNVIGVARKRRH